jgi:hypothetical protein
MTGLVVGRSLVQREVASVLASLVRLSPDELQGLAFAFAQRGGGAAGANAVVAIFRNFPGRLANDVFGTLTYLSAHSEGLNRVIGYLISDASNLNMAALGQLFAARRLLEEFPGRRLIFEAPVERAGRVIREIDVRVVTPHTGVTLLEVELKEVTGLFALGTEHARQQFARDIIRSTQTASRAGGQPLERIRWLIREQELAAQFGGRDQARQQVRDLLRQAFDHPEVLRDLTAAERAAALRDFDENVARIIHLF